MVGGGTRHVFWIHVAMPGCRVLFRKMPRFSLLFGRAVIGDGLINLNSSHGHELERRYLDFSRWDGPKQAAAQWSGFE